jgi:hypothetical protein
VASFAEKVDRWIDALCAGTRTFEDRALDAQAFERDSFEDGPTAEVRRPHPKMNGNANARERATSGVAPA